jgi:transcriptional antiterminator RfaH
MDSRLENRPDVAASSSASPSAVGAEKCPWYCLRAQPKHEHIAAAHLRKLESVSVCPRVRFKRATRQGLVWVTEAMFPGYLFAGFDLAEMHRQVRYTDGVSGIVQFGDRYPTIEKDALKRLRVHTGSVEIKELKYDLTEGDQVKIVDGPFSGLDAVVTRALPARMRIQVLLDFLGRKIEAEVDGSSVLPQVAHPLAT